MKISVVIPAYNAAAWIGRAIDSVLTQTHPADEIIVVDDGSTDDTVKIISHYGRSVNLIQQKNAGVSAARNAGIMAAKGDWIAFLDADDEWLPEKLQLQVEHLQKHPNLVWVSGNYIRCCCGRSHFQVVSDTGAEKQIYDKPGSGDFFKAYLRNIYGHTDVMFIKKKILCEAGLFNPGLLRIEDDDLWFRIAYRYPYMGYVDKPLAVYHMDTENSLMKSHHDTKILCDFLRSHLVLSKNEGKYDDFLPCATKLIKCWIHWSWADERIYQIRSLINEFGFLVPAGYKMCVYLLTVRPGLTFRCMPFLRKVNKILRLPL